MQTSEQFVNAQRAMLELAQKVSSRALEGASQLYELNMRTAQAALTELPSRLQQGAGAVASQPASLPAAAQPDLTRLVSYVQQAAAIVNSTGMEIAALLQQGAGEQFAGLNRSGDGQSSAFGTEPFVEAARRSYEVAQQAMSQLWGGVASAGGASSAAPAAAAPAKRTAA